MVDRLPRTRCGFAGCTPHSLALLVVCSPFFEDGSGQRRPYHTGVVWLGAKSGATPEYRVPPVAGTVRARGLSSTGQRWRRDQDPLCVGRLLLRAEPSLHLLDRTCAVESGIR